MKYRVTNNSSGPRVVFHGGRGTGLPVGESREIEMSEGEAANAKAPGVEIEQIGAGEEGAMTAAELLVQSEGMHVKTLQSAAAKILGDATPSTKAEIIAALDERAKADAAAKA